jgi:hypothetical protein
MKYSIPVLALLLATLSGCSIDTSSRPIQPTPAPVGGAQSYCCDSCSVDDEMSICTSCRRSAATSCPVSSQRLVCVSNRVEAPESDNLFTVMCF